MNAEQTLAEMEESLKPKPVPPKPPKKTAVDVEKALLQLPQISKRLTKVAKDLPKIGAVLNRIEADRKNELGLIEKFDFDLQSLVVKTDQNLKQIGGVGRQLEEKLRSLEVLEAKYRGMIDRVNGVLDTLERKLKQL